jgi:hypothetical protein
MSGCGASTETAPSGNVVTAGHLEALIGQVEALSTTQVRTTAHRVIDLYARILKWKVDLAVGAWEYIPPEQRREVLQALVKRLKAMDATIEAPLVPTPVAGASPS